MDRYSGAPRAVRNARGALHSGPGYLGGMAPDLARQTPTPRGWFPVGSCRWLRALDALHGGVEWLQAALRPCADPSIRDARSSAGVATKVSNHQNRTISTPQPGAPRAKVTANVAARLDVVRIGFMQGLL
jgi:hypothetical protein